MESTADLLLSVQWFGKTIELVVNEGGAPPEPTEVAIERGDILFVVGSALYSVAAFTSGLKAAGDSTAGPGAALRRRTAVATASLYELGGVAFIVGTLGFIPASVLSIDTCTEGVAKLSSAGATLFVAGSVLYLVGAVLTLGVTAWLTYDGPDDAFSPTSSSSWDEKQLVRDDDFYASTPTYSDYVSDLESDDEAPS